MNVYIDLYKEVENATKNLSKLTEEIKINIANADKISIKNNVNKVNRYCNIKSYLIHARQQHKKIKKYINLLHSHFKKYADTVCENDFIDNYGQRVFELIAARVIDREYTLLERKLEAGLPDWKFQANGKTYYLECATRASNFVNDYIEFAAKFNEYFTVAQIFYQQNEALKAISDIHYEEWWFAPIIVQQNIWLALNDENKNIVWSRLGLRSDIPEIINKDHLEDFKKWIFLSRYMLFYFKELLPNDLLVRMQYLNLISSGLSFDGEEINFFRKKILPKFVAQMIVGKLVKSYFHDNNPVIIFVSLSLLADAKIICDPLVLFKEIAFQLPAEINKEANGKPNKKNRIKKGIENLYAIILDTTWYNWFPGFNSQVRQGSSYGIIYNASIAESRGVNSDKDLFKSQTLWQEDKQFYII